MKTRALFAVTLGMGLLLLAAWGAAAQGPDVGSQATASTRWVAVSQPGFGNPDVFVIQSLVPAGQYLYAGAQDNHDGADLYRSADGTDWTLLTDDGFGDPNNLGVEHLAEFKGNLYAGTAYSDTVATESGQIWRSGTGLAWTQVTPPGLDPTNKEIGRLTAFDGMLYAATWSYTDTHGSEIWRTASGDAGDWTRVVENGFGDAGNVAVVSTEEFGGRVYAGTLNSASGGQVWRSVSGDAGDWQPVNAGGFGDSRVAAVSALAAFDDYLYAGTRTRGTDIGIQVWRCQTCDGSDWTKVVDNGFGNPDANWLSALEVFEDRLYLLIGNPLAGLEAWRTLDGVVWENVGRGGLTVPTNLTIYWDNTMAVFEDDLYVGTIGDLFGFTRQAEVLRYVPAVGYLPVVTR